MRVATFNIRTGLGWDGRDSWPFRRRRTAQAVARLEADIVGLQEARPFQLRWLLARLPAFAAIGAGRDDGRSRGEQCAILYRPDRLTLIEQSTRWLSETPDVPGSHGWGAHMPRIATMGVFEAIDERPAARFGVVDTHWEGDSAAIRERSAQLLLSWLDPRMPWIVLGDLNATPTERSVRILLDSGLTDALGHLPARGPGTATHHRFDGATDGTRIDHILVSREWEVRQATVAQDRVDGRLPSDHWPVVVSLAMREESRTALGGRT
jgi:endonuclease/exonuclease/phosphatase family metal-dependent hydrolase